MSATKIEWADRVWNPITGCTPVGAGCDNCYARRMADRFGRRGIDKQGTPHLSHNFRCVLFHPDRMDRPLRWRQKECEECHGKGMVYGGIVWPDSEPRFTCQRCGGSGTRPLRIFVNSMGDLFHEDVPVEWIDKVHDVIYQQINHTFIILTKRPERARDYYIRMYEKWGWATPVKNLHLYVSVWDQESADKFIPILLDTPASVRGVSIEPMLGPIDLDDLVIKEEIGEHHFSCLYCDVGPEDDQWNGATIDHVILGGETGPGARPMHPDWVRSVRDQCQAAGVPFFFKGWGAYVPSEWHDGKTADHTKKTPKKQAPNYMRLDGRTWEELP